MSRKHYGMNNREMSCTKERINEKGTYISVEWSRVNKKKINEEPKFWLNVHVQKKY